MKLQSNRFEDAVVIKATGRMDAATAPNFENQCRKWMEKGVSTFVVDLERSHGSWLTDRKTGREYLDLFSCFASIPVGWNHPDVVSWKEEFGRIAINNVTNSDIYTSEMAWAVDTIANIAKPNCFNHQFFIAGGALAIENCLKTAMDWKVQKNPVIAN